MEEGPDYFRLFNSRNAKLVAALILAVVLVYHGFLKILYGEDTCIGLLEDGRYQGEHIWQPYGCMLHMYTQSDCRTCMKYKQYWGEQNSIVLAGDERMWDLYASFLAVLSSGTSPSTPTWLTPRPDQEPDHQYAQTDLNLKMEFYYEPRVDQSMKKLMSRLTARSKPPNLFILGAGLVSLIESEGSEKSLTDYGFNVSLLLPYIQLVHDKATILWTLQAPLDESKISPNQSFIKNRLLDRYNLQAISSLSYSPVKIWKSSKLLSQGYNTDSSDGIRIGPVALNYNTQILLNLYCNDLLNFSDGTCCSHPEAITRLQLSVLLCLAVCMAIRLLIGFSQCQMKEWSLSGAMHKEFQPGVTPELAVPPTSPFATFLILSRLALILVFFYSCDRANVFMKENKWFTHFNFLMPAAYLTVLGIFFTEETTKTNFMHRDQTDEWKGWMQLIILCFHMTGAAKILWINMLAKCLISSYLFLLGYGHFQYFWTTGDFQLKRVFRVLFRYNFLAVILCVTMNRPYQFYYYVPVASFWFLLCYATLAFPPHVTATSVQRNSIHYLVMVVKLVVFFTIVSILYLSEVFFEKVFLTRPWKALFVTPDDSIQSWWFRWWTDRYETPRTEITYLKAETVNTFLYKSAGAGMVLAFLTNVLRRHLMLTDSQPSNLFSRRLSSLVAFSSICGISVYILIMAHCRGKSDCMELHGYLGVLPIVSYLMLRNVFGVVRCRVSTFFAWFGRISIEMFIAQSHVWLAADTHGVLVLLPRWPVFNVILTSFIFVCVAHEVSVLTRLLTPVFVPDNEPAVILRNFLVLLVFCIPLGFLYGAF